MWHLPQSASSPRDLARCQAPLCGEPNCVAEAKASKHYLYVGPNQRKCEGPGCDKFIPEGRYDLAPTIHLLRRVLGTTSL